MKKLTKYFAPLFVIVFTLTAASPSFATSAPERTLPTFKWLDKTAESLVARGDHYARRGQIALAIEYYSRSIRIGKLNDPNYEDLATQNKIVALIKQQNAQKVQLAVVQLIWQGDDCAATQPEQALEYYSQSIRVGKQYNDQYEDAATQEKIVKLVKVLGNQLH